jgi:hypothetical protein
MDSIATLCSITENANRERPYQALGYLAPAEVYFQ